MARRLGVKENTLTLRDNISGSDIELTYRMPTTKERQGYSNAALVRQGDQVVANTIEARLEYGMEILTGIREGDFEIEKDGEWVTISSDKSSSSYDPEWKAHVEADGADLVMVMAGHVFDGNANVRTMPTKATKGEDQSQD